MKRQGTGLVLPFQNFEKVPGKRRKLSISDWRVLGKCQSTGLEPGITIVAAKKTIPVRLRCSHEFEHRNKQYHIYLDVLYVDKHCQLVRFLNGPLCHRRFTQLQRATTELCRQTLAVGLAWESWDGQWKPWSRARVCNSITRQQAQSGQHLLEVEQALAMRPAAHQCSAWPMLEDAHYRNWIRRLVLQGQTLESIGHYETGSKSKRFAQIFQIEAAALGIQQAGLCYLCWSRPVSQAYPCGHAIACVGCAPWLACALCVPINP